MSRCERAGPRYRQGQRGVALITGMLIVALATVIAGSMVWDTFLDQRRTTSLLMMDQALLYALGAEAWAADTLRLDRENSKHDHLGEDWAYTLPPLPIQGGQIAGQLEDLQGRFNVNNLIDPDGLVDEAALEQFQRLLTALELEPSLAGLLADWIDADALPGFPDGAEDGVYSGRVLPYRTANVAITSISELTAVEGYDRATLEILRPHISTLPPGVPINVNTATGPVLRSLSAELTDADADNVIELRAESGFETVEQFLDAANTTTDRPIVVASDWFRAVIRVSVGTSQFTLYSLLQRDGAGLGHPVLRSFGME